MYNFEPKVVLIIGAGASRNHGLPLASEYVEKLLSKSGIRSTGPSIKQIDHIKSFVSDVFLGGDRADAEMWPSLEEVFTCIDLAANSGHSLGCYSPAELRTIRRALIARTIRMLSQLSGRQWRKEPILEIGQVNFRRLLVDLDASNVAVLSMNWDTVVEEAFLRSGDDIVFNYGFDIKKMDFNSRLAWVDTGRELNIVKPHGSINWLYCDCCRQSFWVDPKSYEKVAHIAFTSSDWSRLKVAGDYRQSVKVSRQCPECNSDSLGVRLVTFSFKKALDAPMNIQSWFTAERYLKRSPHWVFLGYSLPDADYEFKFLLKRIQLSECVHPPRITVITKSAKGDKTIQRYKSFFGSSDRMTYFVNGLDSTAMQHLESIGVIT